MPLTDPVDRKKLHRRDISVQGYQRDDGLFDIEAHLIDTKTYGFPIEGGFLPAGEPLHEMWVRMTVDRDMRITDCQASTEHGPYAICPTGAVNFSRLVGLQIRPGFLRMANERVAGTAGCTHIRELLQQLATIAYQTLYAVRSKTAEQERADTRQPALLDSCAAFARSSPVVKRRWPQFYEATATSQENNTPAM